MEQVPRMHARAAFAHRPRGILAGERPHSSTTPQAMKNSAVQRPTPIPLRHLIKEHFETFF